MKIRINAIEYELDEDGETGAPRWSEGRMEDVRQTVDVGDLSNRVGNPLSKFMLAHFDTFDGGFGASKHDRSEPNRYGASTGAYMLSPRRFGPANKLYHVGFGVRDPGAEEASSPWTATNASIPATLSIANSYEGEYHWAFTTSLANGTAYQALANPTVFRSAALTFRGMGRMSATAAGEAGRLFIWDDVSGFTYSPAVSGTTYTAMTVTATINATATVVRVGIADNGTAISTQTFRADALGIASAGTDIPVGFAVIGTDLYSAAGRFKYQWNGTNSVFDVVHVRADNATSIATLGTNVFVGYGTATAFDYGSGTTWTASTLTGNSKFADYFVRGMDRAGSAVLWRGFKPNTVGVSSNPVNGGTVFTEYTVGEADADLTGLHWWNRTVLAGKEDGLYPFASTYFTNATSEKRVSPSTENFAKSQEFQGALFLSAAQGGVYRWQSGTLIGPLDSFKMEGFEYGPGGKTGALGTDGNSLLVGFNQRDSTSTAWLLQSNDGETIHTLYDFCAPDTTQWGNTTLVDVHFEEMTTIDAIQTFSGYTYVAGRTTTGVTRIELCRFAVPTTSETPFRDTAPDPVTRFYIRLPRITLSSEIISFADLTIGSRNLSAGTRTIPVVYRLDNGAWTTLATANTSPYQTLTFSNVNGQELELLLECISTSGATSPIEILPVTVRGTLRPTVKRLYTAFVRIGTLIGGVDGQNVVELASTQMSNLRTAETSKNPVAHVFVEDFNADNETTTSVNVHVLRVALDHMYANPEGGWVRVYGVTMLEA